MVEDEEHRHHHERERARDRGAETHLDVRRVIVEVDPPVARRIDRAAFPPVARFVAAVAIGAVKIEQRLCAPTPAQCYAPGTSRRAGAYSPMVNMSVNPYGDVNKLLSRFGFPSFPGKNKARVQGARGPLVASG